MPRKKNWKRIEAGKKACMSHECSSISVSEDVVSNDDLFIEDRDSDENSSRSLDMSSQTIRDELLDPLVVCGSFHQADVAKFSIERAGRQCIPNGLMSLMFSKLKPMNEWTSGDLDAILINGDELYGHIQSSSTMSAGYLLVTELPDYLDAFNTTFTLVRDEPKAGYIWPSEDMIQFGDLVTLQTALDDALADRSSCFINFCQSVFVATHFDGSYFIFDSHSRSREGMLSVDGSSILLQFHSVHAVYEHCIRLALSMNANANTLFEVTAVSVSCHNEIETVRTCRIQREGKMPFVKQGVAKLLKRKKPRYDNCPQSSASNNTKSTIYPSDKEESCSDVSLSESDDSNSNVQDINCIKIRRPQRARKKSSLLQRKAKRVSMRTRRSEMKTTNVETTIEKRSIQAAEKYSTNEEYRLKLKRRTTMLYEDDDSYRKKLKTASTVKYAQNAAFRESVKSSSSAKYRSNLHFRESVKTASKDKYRQNEEFRQAVKSATAVKYKNNPMFREQLRQSNQRSRQKKTCMNKKMANVMSKFKRLIAEGPEYVCSVCHRRLFKHQVLKCLKSKYLKAPNLAENCITNNYFHECNGICSAPCRVKEGPLGKLWICHTCDRKLKSGKKPAESVINNLRLAEIPRELDCLNKLEQHLISLNIPFMKMTALPKGGQHGVHGPTICVPSNVNKTISVLPRCELNDQLVRVKLKRKLSYKGHYEYQFVNTENIKRALAYLKANNPYYSDVDFDNAWINLNEEQYEPHVDSETEMSKSDVQDGICDSEPKRSEHDNDENGLLLDTCLQPIDIGQHILDNNLDSVLNISPCEGSTPARISTDETNEAKCFPVLFPNGSPTFHDQRDERLTLGRYLNNRLLNADNRFAKNCDYIFYAQYLSELEQVKSNVSISLRKSSASGNGDVISSKNLTNRDDLREILKHDEGYKFLKPIRGTPPFWQAVQKDIFAMIRQLGIPTWFCSFSSAEFRWTEIVDSILRETGDARHSQDLDWNAKCLILRKNPVTSARMFNERFHSFLTEVIMSPAAPIGKVVDYFYRVEFQQRGSPHTHCLFWIENAPQISNDLDNDADVVDFVDKYVTCELPDASADKELHDIVDSVQKHSKNHSNTCRKTGKTCRFNFPRPPSCATFICHASKEDSTTVEDLPKNADGNPDLDELLRSTQMTSKTAQVILTGIWNEINDENKSYDFTDDLFEALGMTQSLFEDACSALGKKTSVVLQRQPRDVWINQYNSDLLRCWNANMDIQYVVDAYSCVVYIISYISKAEREMGILLSQTEKEAREQDNIDAKQAMKKIGHAYLTHREVSAQESVFRVCNLHLKQASRKVQFIPVGIDPVRLSLPLATIKQRSSSGEFNEDDMWATSIVDRYMNRPNGADMDNLCLAHFCSEYRIVSSSEISRVDNSKRRTPLIELQNGLGFMQKRSNSQPAVIRYPRFSRSKQSEKFFQSILQLFLPHRIKDHLKPQNFDTYEHFYDKGFVQIENALHCVKEIVDENRKKFEKDPEELEIAENVLENSGLLEDAWSQICPETELERHECEELLAENDWDDEIQEVIPDLLDNENTETRLCTMETVKSSLTKNDAKKLLQSLNTEQSTIFYKIRQWALDKRNGREPQPFHLFLHGPGGTGKSMVIKAINYECNRLLSKIRENPDDISVLLAAPTGVAAFNINAQTIHSAFSIGIDAYLPYVPLTEEKINTLRCKFRSLQLVIIDEISMVDHKLLTYIHGRLRQIKQTPEDVPFGNISVLAVGDFYQLPPVKGKPLFVEKVGVDLFNDYFVKAELSQIMRQNNRSFAETLNRLRIRERSVSLDTTDIETLQSRETGQDLDCIHIFALNSDVDKFNLSKLRDKCVDVKTIQAEDVMKQRQTGVLLKKSKCGTFALPKTINIGVGARVMLTRNVDTADGLVNGVFGTVHFLQFKGSEQTLDKIYVLFDDSRVGENLRKSTKFPSSASPHSTPIVRQEESAKNGSGTRLQFPLKLAWACTVHKTQGLTFEQAVVSFDAIRTPGQAYVALSRVTSLEGLVLQKFNPDKIYCNEHVTKAMSKMKQFLLEPVNIHDDNNLTLILHNVQGLEAHFQCLKSDSRFMDADFICLTETWLSEENVLKECLPSYSFYHQSRNSSYDNSNQMFKNLKSQLHGGVGVFVKADVPVRKVEGHFNLEHTCLYLPERKLVIVLVYRPPTYKISECKHNLSKMISDVTSKFQCGMIVCGDFNDDINKSSSIKDLFRTYGFTQLVSDATTEDGSIIDHVYSRNIPNISVTPLPTFYSFHEAVQINIKDI